ncbi:MAG TPA: c(7)-type cytochrome triheme domain-containing protein [Thermohalobaculum sp.]|nr:c(7)-type cytochrome triheme domain-containing protein [Thermohalobaculum sp.]
MRLACPDTAANPIHRLAAALLVVALVGSCAESTSTPVDIGSAASAVATVEPAASAPDTAPESAPVPAPAAEPPTPGGFEPARNVTGNPELAADQPTGQATARWGESGRDVGGDSPWRSLAYDGIHDRNSEAVRLLQEPASALRSLPRGRSGNLIDWAAALRDGAIRPRARAGSQGSMEVLDLDIRFFETKNMPIVTFPHSTHTEWLSCSNCHDWLFKAQRGANDITMTAIARGRACGLCHGKVAFPATDCFRCHNGPRPK